MRQRFRMIEDFAHHTFDILDAMYRRVTYRSLKDLIHDT